MQERRQLETSGFRHVTVQTSEHKCAKFQLSRPSGSKVRVIPKNFVYYPPGTRVDLSPALGACHEISDAIAEMTTEVIRSRIDAGVIRTDLTPRALMLLLWGQIVGVMQILRMRQEHFEETFGLSREILFDHFVRMMETALTKQGACSIFGDDHVDSP